MFSKEIPRQNIESVIWMFRTEYDKELLERDQLWQKLVPLQA